ncbi:MAG: hypothetical protein QQN63_04670 [Nitrosopumilus sp.]
MPSLDVRPIDQEELPQVKDWIHNSHYIGRWPAGVRHKMGVYIDEKLVGTLLYGPSLHSSAGTNLFRDKDNKPIMQNNQTVELLRAFTTDESKKLIDNLGSQIIAAGNNWLRDKGTTTDGKPIKAILSYADPEAGHSGNVYKATNAAYLGVQRPGKVLVIKDPKTGKTVEAHSMSVDRTYKTGNIDKLKEHPKLKGMEIEWRETSGKHKYLYPLGKDQRERDELMSQLNAKLFSYPEPGKTPHEIPNEFKARAEKLKGKQQPKKDKQSKHAVIKQLLRIKIPNPETGNKIMVATALGYDKSHPANRTAQNIVKSFAQRHDIKIKPSRISA